MTAAVLNSSARLGRLFHGARRVRTTNTISSSVSSDS